MKYFVFFVLLLFIVPMNNFTLNSVASNENVPQTTTEATSTTVYQNYSRQMNIYINALIKQGENISPDAMRWKKYLNLPGNDTFISQYYYGWYYGASGIGLLFLQLYASTNNETYLQIAEKAGNYLLINVLSANNNSLTGWTRSEDSGAIYSSEKYGLAGIVTFLLNLYKYSNNNTYLSYAESTLQLLFNYKTLTPYGYAYNYTLVGTVQASITDYIYGATGVARSFLTAYQVTNDRTYLDTCTTIMSWVLNMTVFSSLDANGMRRVFFSTDPSYWYYFTGYQSGAAGIGDFLLSLYNVTTNSNYLLYAKQLGNWLLYEENGTGIWSSYNTVDYLTDQYTSNPEGTFLGFSAGASGDAIYLMHLYQVTNNSQYLGPVVRVKNLLEQYELVNGSQIYWKAQLTGNFQDRIDTGLSVGVAGIGLFFIKYYEYFGGQDILNVLTGINNFYDAITTKDGLVPDLLNTTTVIYDSSYLEGLTGIITYYSEVVNNVQNNSNYSTQILNNITAFVEPKNPVWYSTINDLQETRTISEKTNSGQNSSTTTTNVNFTLSFVPLFGIFLVIAIKRKKQLK